MSAFPPESPTGVIVSECAKSEEIKLVDIEIEINFYFLPFSFCWILADHICWLT